MNAQAFREDLLRFYDRSHRDLPWRHTRDPYAIWISEVMSQQTRVETVVPYYERWLASFPNIRTLALAPEETVLKHWEGLGYYSRARNIHRAAKLLLEQMGAKLPEQAAELGKLPGIGPYTAGAIASIAFGEVVPAVDGNVLRVLSRVADYDGDIRSERQKRPLVELAQQLVSPRRPGDFNQAVMELGATVCTPRSPRCEECPVVAHCAGRYRAEELPYKSRLAPPRPEYRHAWLCEDPQGSVLVGRTPLGSLLGGLWQPLLLPVELGVSAADENAAQELFSRKTGLLPAIVHVGEPVVHEFSHIRMTLEPILAMLPLGSAVPALDGYEEIAWMRRDAWEAITKSTLVLKLLHALGR